MANFTKGEWKVGEHKDSREFFIVSGNKTIAFTSRGRTEQDYIEVEANANLIAASKDMYEAAKELIEWYNEMQLNHPEIISPLIWNPLVKAVAKAEGK